MNHDTFVLLDQPELFQLALTASGAGDGASAIAYLKAAVSRADATAGAHYLLGAEYAQIGLYDRAMDQMEAAIALDPALWTARLQLALLYLGASREERAAECLRPLAESGSDAALRAFADGLLALIAGDLPAAERALRAGIDSNATNLALNGDMERIVLEVRQRLEETSSGDVDPETSLLLSAYAGHQRH